MAKAEIIATPEVPIRHYDPRDANGVVYEVNPRSKKTVYYLRGSQAKDVSKITLDGYEIDQRSALVTVHSSICGGPQSTRAAQADQRGQ
jgi:hypothetical protein